MEECALRNASAARICPAGWPPNCKQQHLKGGSTLTVATAIGRAGIYCPLLLDRLSQMPTRDSSISDNFSTSTALLLGTMGSSGNNRLSFCYTFE